MKFESIEKRIIEWPLIGFVCIVLVYPSHHLDMDYKNPHIEPGQYETTIVGRGYPASSVTLTSGAGLDMTIQP